MGELQPLEWEATMDNLIGVIPDPDEGLCTGCPLKYDTDGTPTEKFERVALHPKLSRAIFFERPLSYLDTQQIGIDTGLSTARADEYARCLTNRLNGGCSV